MIDIGKLTWYQTKNLAKNFLEIKNQSDVDKFLNEKIFLKDFLMFGGGSNLLFGKDVYEDIYFLKNSWQGIEYLGENAFCVKAGQNLGQFISYLNSNFKNNNLNPIYAIPGTVGGAVIGNAGSYGVEIGSFVKQLKLIDDYGEIIETDEYLFGYRYSNLKNKRIVLLEVVIQLPELNNPDFHTMDFYMEKSLQTKEYKKTCGSYFKNYSLTLKDNIDMFFEYPDFPARKNIGEDNIVVPAGWMIDKCGLRGFEMDGVRVSPKHANFIQNLDNEESENILKLVKFIKQKVFEKFKVVLKEEVIII